MNPHSENAHGVPEAPPGEHPHDDPQDWGWHAEFGRSARVAGWVVAIILVVMITATHYNQSGSLWLIIFAVGLIAILIWDVQRRKSAWRK